MSNLIVALLRISLLAVVQYFLGDRVEERAVERRLRFYATAYMLLGVSFLFAAAPAHPLQISADSGCPYAVIGLLLWISGVALLFLSSMPGRFRAAAEQAARVAPVVLEPLIELLIAFVDTREATAAESVLHYAT